MILALCAAPAAAQRRAAPACTGQIITAVNIHPDRPSFEGASGQWRRMARAMGFHHQTTSERIVRRFMLLVPGEPCDEFRRAESERVLRAQPYLADARVRAVPAANGTVRLDVQTVDEIPAYGAATLSRGSLGLLRIGNSNLFGQAVAADVQWQNGFFYRDGYGAHITDYQFLGYPLQLTVAGERRVHGNQWRTDLTYPFYSELQRVAWLAAWGGSDDFVRFRREGVDEPTLPVARRFVNVGGVGRVGPPGRLGLFGLTVSREVESPSQQPLIVSDTGLIADTSAVLTGRYAGFRTTRLNGLVGLRTINFMRVTGFDALAADQDVRRGVEVGALAGRPLPLVRRTTENASVSGVVYAGVGTPASFLATQVQGEARESSDIHNWDGIVSSGRLAWYLQPRLGNTFITSAEVSGGWRQRIPFQLALGDPLGGVRGFQGSRIGGARRLVVRAENRRAGWRYKHVADLGVAGFVDAGKMWAGDAPFGVNTPVRVGVGAGLLAAFPPRSKRLWRVDVAVPLTHDRYARWEIRASSTDFTRFFWREPSDVARGRERTIPPSVFNWP